MKDKLFCMIFFCFLATLAIMSIILPDQEVSKTERRVLTKVPSFQTENHYNEDYFTELDRYFVDHIVGRETFRTIKALAQKYLFGVVENNHIFEVDGYLFERNDTIHTDSINHFTNLLKQIKENYLQDQEVYLAIIPDKNYYLEDSTKPKLDYESFMEQIIEPLSDTFHIISLEEDLQLENYYKTDIHWKQETLEPIAKKIVQEMNGTWVSSPKEEKNFSNFAGSYYGRMSLPLPKDQLTFLTNDILAQVVVTDYETKEQTTIYNEDKLTSVDSYDLFLNGARALLTLENKNQTNGKELIVFRDSFGSSIVPLWIESYQKITLIDLRYIASSYLEQVIDFTNQDILFLYSIPSINQSFTMK